MHSASDERLLRNYAAQQSAACLHVFHLICDGDSMVVTGMVMEKQGKRELIYTTNGGKPHSGMVDELELLQVQHEKTLNQSRLALSLLKERPA